MFNNVSEIIIAFSDFIEDDTIITTVGYHDFKLRNSTKTKFVFNWSPLHFIISGKGYITINDKTYEAKKGDIFIIPKDTEVIYYPNPEEPWSYFWISNKGKKSSKYIEMIGLSIDKPVIKSDNSDNILNLLSQIISNHQHGISVGYYEVLSAFYKIIDYLTCEKIIQTHDLTKSILKYINYHFSRDSLTVEELCKYFNISHSYLCKLFKKHGELSAKGTIIKIRLDEAKKLLSDTNLSVKQIAYSVGFTDDTYFMKTFKKTFGITPTEYRNKILN